MGYQGQCATGLQVSLTHSLLASIRKNAGHRLSGGTSWSETQRLQDKSFNDISATTFNIDYRCRLGIGCFGAHKFL